MAAVVNISTGNINFAPAMHIFGALKQLFEQLAKEKLLAELGAPEFVERAAFSTRYLNRTTE